PLHQVIVTRRPTKGFGTPGPIPTGEVNSLDLIKKLLDHGANINARMTKNGMKNGQRNKMNRMGATPFLLAAKNADTDVMKLLLSRGANPQTPTVDGNTPLMVAAGVAVWNPGEDGGTLLGSEDERLEAVKMCVGQGNDVNAVNIEGETPLHGAAYIGDNRTI